MADQTIPHEDCLESDEEPAPPNQEHPAEPQSIELPEYLSNAERETEAVVPLGLDQFNFLSNKKGDVHVNNAEKPFCVTSFKSFASYY